MRKDRVIKFSTGGYVTEKDGRRRAKFTRKEAHDEARKIRAGDGRCTVVRLVPPVINVTIKLQIRGMAGTVWDMVEDALDAGDVQEIFNSSETLVLSAVSE